MSASIIVLSRQVCTGGCDVGKKAAAALGIPYYDKELISMAARESGLSEQAVAANEQRRTGSLLYSLPRLFKSCMERSIIHHFPLCISCSPMMVQIFQFDGEKEEGVMTVSNASSSS